MSVMEGLDGLVAAVAAAEASSGRSARWAAMAEMAMVAGAEQMTMPKWITFYDLPDEAQPVLALRWEDETDRDVWARWFGAAPVTDIPVAICPWRGYQVQMTYGAGGRG